MRASIILPAALAGILFSTIPYTNAHAQSTTGAGQSTGSGSDQQKQMAESSSRSMSGEDSGNNSSVDSKSFVKRAAQSNLAEIKVSQLALSQAQSPEVKSFAQHMIDDHTQANSQLADLAQSKSLKVPDDTDMMHKASMKMLQSKSGAGFDSAYLKQMDKDHKKTVELFQSAANSPNVDKDLQAFAKKLLPKLQQHEQMVAQVESKMPSRSASSQ